MVCWPQERASATIGVLTLAGAATRASDNRRLRCNLTGAEGDFDDDSLFAGTRKPRWIDVLR